MAVFKGPGVLQWECRSGGTVHVMVIWPAIQAVREVMERGGLVFRVGVSEVLRWELRIWKESGRDCMLQFGGVVVCV